MATAVEHAEYVIKRVEAQRSSTFVQLGAALGALACIVGAAAMQTPINAMRTELEMVSHSSLYKELPPKYAWVSAAGGSFRGIVSIVLWIRAERLKQDGKYYESHNLAKWICTLQPKFPTVWSNRAWDLSYNISVGTHTAAERWQWVYNGIRLLRDEGIPNNDRAIGLYNQLAWTWFHKVGDRLDDFHQFYKRIWAASMEFLLGAPPVGLSNKETIDWFRPVAEAPRTLDALVAARPGVAGLVRSLAGIGIDIAAETSVQRLYHPLEERFFRPYTAMLMARRSAELRAARAEPTPEQARFEAVLAAASPPDLDALLAFMRAKVLREQYKMDPQFMLDITGMLGTSEPVPIDWRTPYAQSIYWALYGVKKGEELKRTQEFDVINTDRIMLFSIQKLAQLGRYVLRLDLDEPMDSYLAMLPDFRYIEAMHNKYLEMGKKHADEGEDVEGKTSEMLRSGHVNYLHSAIVALYFAGREAEAQKWLDYLTVNYKDPNTGETKEMYLQGLQPFVYDQLPDMVESFQEVVYLLHSMLESAYMALAAGYSDEYTAAINNVALVYKKYQGDKLEDPEGRRALPPFVQVRADALSRFLLEGSHPVIYRVWAWQREQDDVKRQCYDFVAPYLVKLAELEGYDVAKAFPEPPGMEQWRKDHPRPTNPEDLVQQEKERKKAEAGTN